MVKRRLLYTKIIMFLILSLFMVGCSSSKVNEVKSDTSNLQAIKVAIFPSNSDEETYLFEFTSDNLLQVSYGKRNNDDIESDNFLEISKSKRKKLKKDTLDRLYKLANRIQEKEINGEIPKRKTVTHFGLMDGWYVVVLTENEKYKFVYHVIQNKNIESLIDELVKFSPIKVDIHSWV